MLLFFSASGGKTNQPDHPTLQTHFESHSNVNVCPGCYLKVYLCHIDSSEKKSDRLHVYSRFCGNNRQHMPICAKMISSCIREVLSIAKSHVSQYP